MQTYTRISHSSPPHQDGSVDASKCGGAGHGGEVDGEVGQCGQFVELGHAPFGQEQLGMVRGSVVAQHRGEKEHLRRKISGREKGMGGDWSGRVTLTLFQPTLCSNLQSLYSPH